MGNWTLNRVSPGFESTLMSPPWRRVKILRADVQAEPRALADGLRGEEGLKKRPLSFRGFSSPSFVWTATRPPSHEVFVFRMATPYMQNIAPDGLSYASRIWSRWFKIFSCDCLIATTFDRTLHAAARSIGRAVG